ncbi:hypothetical protein EDC96DRAFT_552304 [Choanephora cucurbitarum]|nr:hypothetical protein EDC96DRAFT_552304 [Choanephora cucurbitarum]
MSVSWMAEKTSTELIPLLKNAYSALKDKEKDLVLAAEIGKSLLEHNLRLKSSYDSLLQSTTPPVTPSHSTADDEDMRFIPSRTTREAMIEVLEKKNAELSSKLEDALREQNQLKLGNTKQTRQLESEIDFLRSHLEIASTKIQELQEMNAKQRQTTRAMQQQQNDHLLDSLYSEMDKIKREKELVHQSKTELETKLATTLKDLTELKRQFERFEFTQKDFESLQEAYKRQFDHIEQLNHSLEEHRQLLQKLKETSPTEENGKTTLSDESDWFLPDSFSRATGLDPQLLDDALAFVRQIEMEHEQDKDDFGVPHDPYPHSDLYPSLQQVQCYVEPKTFVGRIRARMQQVFHLIWKWCRFTMVLTAALVINAWQGPDALLITY